MKIRIINQIYSLKELKIPPELPVGIIYLPADFYSMRISMRRLWMKSKVIRLMIIMNPIGLSPHIVREIPEYCEMEVSDEAIGDCGVPPDRRDEYVTGITEKMVLREYKTFIWDPEVEITERKTLYKAVYIQRSDGETHLYDTYSGKKVLVENPLFIPKTL